MPNNQSNSAQPTASRRSLLKSASAGFGYLALAGLTTQDALARPAATQTAAPQQSAFSNPLAPKSSHFPGTAKRVIFMFMQGGPSQWETFDHCVELEKAAGKTASAQYNGRKFGGKVLGPRWKFKPNGDSGLHISEIFPNLSQHADDLCLLNGMHTDSPAHPTATIQLHTGSFTFVRPSMGAWAVYGLGTEAQDLPGFITINPQGRLGGAQNYGSAFLPAAFQGTRVTNNGASIANIKNPYGNGKIQREHLNLIQALNKGELERSQVNPQLEGVIQSYELGYHMQAAVPRAMDISKEPEHIKKAYGITGGATRDFGSQCLMARRLAESGVRFIEIAKGGWDQHNGLRTKIKSNANAIDQPIAALIHDLKQRGMFDETLVVWGGEFGRTPLGQNTDGRRHNNRGYSMWMAGGGIKGGIAHGMTDPISGTAMEGKVHLHDLHATILHCLGLDHTKLTYKHAGRDFRLTDVYGNVVNEILA